MGGHAGGQRLRREPPRFGARLAVHHDGRKPAPAGRHLATPATGGAPTRPSCRCPRWGAPPMEGVPAARDTAGRHPCRGPTGMSSTRDSAGSRPCQGPTGASFTNGSPALHFTFFSGSRTCARLTHTSQSLPPRGTPRLRRTGRLQPRSLRAQHSDPRGDGVLDPRRTATHQACSSAGAKGKGGALTRPRRRARPHPPRSPTRPPPSRPGELRRPSSPD